MEKYDIIRFYSDNRKKRLILKGVTEKQKDEWCNSEKTRKAYKFFDGFTDSNKTSFDCQNDKPMYPSNYTVDDLAK